MSKYPDYPDNRLIVNNVDLSTNFQMILIDGYVLSPPEPKFHRIDVPGGNGVIDLTESLTGDVLYGNRSQDFVFKLIYPNDFEEVKTKISNFLHGRAYDYQMTMDPDYTYHGRFTVSSYNHDAYADGILGDIQIHIDADPYKKLDMRTYRINAPGGRWYRLPSGRMPVRPVMETKQATTIVWNDELIKLGAGSFRLNDVLFKEGVNNIYINTYPIYDTHWEDLGENGSNRMTWDQAKEYSWDEIQRINIQGDVTSACWNDLNTKTWNELKESSTTWNDLDYKPDNGESSAYIQYEWGDL